ncbi:hypothetical protein AVEN_166020-1 [Araneus ventricosus]|uniref:Integrase zinc-binding domain-containing protein n=1 Tax=Araneus ventricosus TaxID=182803 RepID=A0A4Y2L4L3_ARAVE|nr:hypothetical protein AVEN_166020-1 [Araneus ventricosus]
MVHWRPLRRLQSSATQDHSDKYPVGISMISPHICTENCFSQPLISNVLTIFLRRRRSSVYIQNALDIRVFRNLHDLAHPPGARATVRLICSRFVWPQDEARHCYFFQDHRQRQEVENLSPCALTRLMAEFKGTKPAIHQRSDRLEPSSIITKFFLLPYQPLTGSPRWPGYATY